jgi:hypothetical protein
MSNVIQFPGKRPAAKPVDTSQSETRTRYDLEHRKVLMSASIVSIIFVVTLANRALLRENLNSGEVAAQSRSLASVDESSHLTPMHRDTQWERTVAEQLSIQDGRKPASLGRTPSPQEKLQFGVLAGKYLMHYRDGKVEQLTYDPNAKDDSPKYLEDPKSFLENNKSVLSTPFDEAVLNSKQVSPTKVLETYDLLETEKPVGHAQFELDIYGRLLSMTIERNNHP